MQIKKDIIWRVAIIYFGLLLLAFAIIGKVIYMNMFEREQYIQKANSVTLKDIIIEPNRGDIYSSGGRLLAASVPFYEVRMDVNSTAMDEHVFYKNIDSLSHGLSQLFGDKTAEAYRNDLITARKNGSRYHLIKKRVNYRQLEKLRELPILRLGRYKGGLIVKRSNERLLPHYNLASRTIGYLSHGDQENVVGLEGAYDEYLKGQVGVRLMRRITKNVWMPINNDNEVEPEDGKDIITTLDVNLQDVAENALMKQLQRFGAHHGTAVLMEVSTGNVKAIANLQLTEDGKYGELYNYAVGESTEPGSVFKLPVLMTAFEDGYVDLLDTIDTKDGKAEYYGIELRDSREGGYGKITVKEAFEYSSNVALSKIVTDYYEGKEYEFIERLYSMNLNEKLGIKIKGEGEPLIKYPDDKYWSGLTLPWMSIGYEVRMTPLQILTFYNAVANNGKMMKPVFVEGIAEHGKITKRFKKEVINPSICSMETIAKAKLMLEGAVENGTARNLKNANYKIAGKTGTAQIANKKYGYEQEGRVSYQASFVGYFPADDPKYSCIVVVNSPSRSVYYGNIVAGPVFKEIADKVYATHIRKFQQADNIESSNEHKIPYSKHSYKVEMKNVLHELDIPYDDKQVDSDWVVSFRRDSCIELKNRFIKEKMVPNIVGMGAKDAIYILENLGLRVMISGKGTVYYQSIEPDTRVQEGEKILIKLG